MPPLARPAAVAGGLLASVIVPRLLVFPVVNFGPDEIAYGLIGRELLHGNWPYTTAFDHKPVALYLPYALAVGVVGETTTALRVLTLVVGVAAFSLVYLICRRLRLSTYLSATMASLYGLMSLGNEGLGALSENTLNVYLLLMVYLLLRRASLVVALLFGAVMGLVVHTNYLCGPLCAVLGIYFLWRERAHLLRWAGAAVGLAIMTTAVLAPVAAWSDLGEYFRLQLDFFGGYDRPPQTLQVRLWRFQDFLAPTMPVVFVSAVLAALAPPTRTRAAARWALLAATALVAITVNDFYWPHYALLLTPPVVLLLASQLRAVPRGRQAVALVTVGVAVWSLVLPAVLPIAVGIESIGRQHSLAPDREAHQSQVAAAVREIVDPGDVIYSRGLHYYFLTSAALPTRFFFPSHHTNPAFSAALGTSLDEEMRKILAKRPRAVVLDRRPRPDPDRLLVDYLETQCREPLLIGQTRIYDCR